jgi:uncharacterized membrane protein
MLVSVFALGFLLPAVSYAAGNVTSTNTYAWGDVIGWVNFNPTNGNVTVTDASVTGYAWSANYGWINLAPTNGGVVNDGNGNLSGKAWGANTGWIDFTGVSINSSGRFVGQTASTTLAGVINFSCANCLVTTSWRPTRQTTPTSTNPTSNPSSSSGSGSYVGGGFSSPVPYILTASTTLTTTAPNGLIAYPSTKKSYPASSKPLSPNNYDYGSNSISTSSGSHIHSNTNQQPSENSTATKPFWFQILLNTSTPIKIIGGISLLLLLVALFWKIIQII